MSEMVECQIMAIDQRGHGDTQTSDDADLSAETLARLVYCLFPVVKKYNGCVVF